MIKIYFSSNTVKNIIPEIDLSGNEKDFTQLNKIFRKFLASENQQIKIEVNTEVNSFPYENMLKSLIVLKNNNPVLISVVDNKD